MILHVLSALNSILFAMLFVLPGMMIGWILYPDAKKTGVPLKRIVFGICFSSGLFALINLVNHNLSVYSLRGGIAEYACIVAALALIFARKKIAPTFTFTKDMAFVLLGTAIGTAWKMLFVLPIRNMGSAYDYASAFAKGSVPDLGFYTGMAVDHANYAIGPSNAFWSAMRDALTNPGLDISLFLITFAYLGFVYMLCLAYSSNRMHAFCAMMIMALGPFEIFYTSSSIFGHPIAYLAIFSLFFLFVQPSEYRQGRALAIALCLSMATMYYTSTLANILACGGFCIAILAEKFIARRQGALRSWMHDKRAAGFVMIAVISAGAFIAMSSDMLDFTNDMIQDTTTIRSAAAISAHSTTTVFIGNETLRPYRDPAIFGISAIRAQGLLFMTFGFAYAIWFAMRFRHVRKNRGSPDMDACVTTTLAAIPAVLTSFAFIYAGYPARAFDYFGFLAILMVSVMLSAIPFGRQGRDAGTQATTRRHRITILWITIMIGMVALSLLTMRDKRIYFDRSDGEVTGASWIAKNLKGKVFSDQAFISQVVQNGYYDVTGTSDTDPRLTALFYQNDKNTLLKAASSLEIDYIVTTRRMRESYILMLDTPQVAIRNSDMIDGTLEKVYDNGDVRAYAIGSNIAAPSKSK